MAMFAPTRPQASSYLVEFRCGKLKRNQRMLTADARKGMLYIHQSDDQLMHLCWKDRNTGHIEDDLIIFPDDIEYMPVPECTTGRVFCLKFKTSEKRFFFWMQEPKSDKDDELCKKVNDLLNNPPPPGQRGRSGAEGLGMDRLAALSQLGAPGEGGEVQNMDQNQLMQLLNLMGGGGAGGLDPAILGGLGLGGPAGGPSGGPPAPVAPPTTTTDAIVLRPQATPSITDTPVRAAAAQGLQLSDLQNILGNIPAGEGGPGNQETDIQSFAEVISGESQISVAGSSSTTTIADTSAHTPTPKASQEDTTKKGKDEDDKKDPPENMDLD